MKTHLTWLGLALITACGNAYAQNGATLKNGDPSAVNYVNKSANRGPKQGENRKLSKEARTAKPKALSPGERKSGLNRRGAAKRTGNVKVGKKNAEVKAAQRNSQPAVPRTGERGSKRGSR